MPTHAQIARRYTERALQLIRLGNGQAAYVRRELRQLSIELRQLLAGADVPALSRRSLNVLLRDIEAAIAGRYASIVTQQVATAVELVAIEAAWAQRTSDFPRSVSERATASVAQNISIFGVSLADAWATNRDDLTRRTSGIVREVAAGQAPPETIVPRILGVGPAGREAGGLIQRAVRNADALVHTTISEAATDARLPVWRANGVNAFRWHAVLDEKTTAGCALRHGLLYELDTLKPIRHSVLIEREPPRHYRCRSILLPMAYGPDIPAPEDGGQSTFREYFDSLSEAQQDRLFGEGRADLFRRGVITQADLVGQGGQVLTLRELRESGVFSAYDEASHGGRYHGELARFREMSERELRKSRAAFERQIERHRSWITDPYGTGKLPDGYDPELAAHLINRKWPRDIELLTERLSVALGAMTERGFKP